MPFEFREIVFRAEIQRDAGKEPKSEDSTEKKDPKKNCGSGVDGSTRDAVDSMADKIQAGYFPGVKTWKR